MQDAQQEPPVRYIVQVGVHYRTSIVWLKYLSFFVGVVIWAAAARAVHLEGDFALFLEQVALSGHQVELSEDFKVDGGPDHLRDVQATLQVLLPLVVLLDRRTTFLWHTAAEVLNAD